MAQFGPNNQARAVLWQFLRQDTIGNSLTPFMAGIDNTNDPSQSRIKLYFQMLHTSFSSDLRQLVTSALSLPSDFPASADLPNSHHEPCNRGDFVDFPILLHDSVFYFDIAIGATTPDIKYHALVRRYARGDLSLERSVTSRMRSRGRGAFCERYLSLLDGRRTWPA
ncbi:hypothetical protein GGR56DRAFT_668533 [Xylariaceae sp. FL0804]|nr:hypothetical protein GGR56DRAFT_668533 [Xylariaceae sp. FL0804]